MWWPGMLRLLFSTEKHFSTAAASQYSMNHVHQPTSEAFLKKRENGGWQRARETDDGKRQQSGEQRRLAQSDSVFVCPTASGHETRL